MRYFVSRVMFFVLTLWAAVTLNFLIPRLQPGDPAEIMVQRLAGQNEAVDPARSRRCGSCSALPSGSAVLAVLATTWAAGARRLRRLLHLLPLHRDRR